MRSRDALMGLGEGEPPTIPGSSLDWAFLYRLISFKRILKMGWILHCFVHINYVIQNKIRIFFSHDMYLPVGLNELEQGPSLINSTVCWIYCFADRVRNGPLRNGSCKTMVYVPQHAQQAYFWFKAVTSLYIWALLKRIIHSLAHHHK